MVHNKNLLVQDLMFVQVTIINIGESDILQSKMRCYNTGHAFLEVFDVSGVRVRYYICEGGHIHKF